MISSEPFFTLMEDDHIRKILENEIQQIRRELETLRRLERTQRIDHSTHVDYDGNPCGMAKTWQTKWARDLAVSLDKIGVRDDPDRPEPEEWKAE